MVDSIVAKRAEENKLLVFVFDATRPMDLNFLR